WFQTNTLKFEWDFVQPINITARVKENNNTWTVLQIVSIKNKHIPYGNISISHPEIQKAEKSREAKKYTYYFLNKNEKGKESFTLDEQADGSTENLDFVQMNQINHEYTSVTSVRRFKRSSAKQTCEDNEDTQRSYV